MVGTTKQLRLRECALHREIKGEGEARSGKGRWVEMAHLLHSRALCAWLQAVWGKELCSAVVQVWDWGMFLVGWMFAVSLQSAQTAFNCPLFFLVFLPASSALVLVPRPHHHLQTALGRVEPWKALEPWEGTRPPSTEEIQAGISAPTSAADTEQGSATPVQPQRRKSGQATHRVQPGGEGGCFKDS